MTSEEIKNIPDLQIEVTPTVEDAFYFLQSLENELPDIREDETCEEYEERLDKLTNPSLHAGDRLAQIPYKERMEAIGKAYQMIDNLKKYGVACAQWT